MGKKYCIMDNLINNPFSKYQVTIHFEMDNDFMSLVPSHRVYINNLIDKGTIEYYSVSMETQRCWMIVNAITKKEVQTMLNKSPLKKYWTIEIDELFVYDAQSYRLPAFQLN
jgi:muconolactone delta-isomerase